MVSSPAKQLKLSTFLTQVFLEILAFRRKLTAKSS